QRLAISTDGTKIRLAPDGADFANVPADTQGASSAAANEDTLDKATAGLSLDDGVAAPGGDGDWVTIATFKPDGTCKEDNAVLEIRQDGYPAIRIQIRGVTGTARILPNQSANANQGVAP